MMRSAFFALAVCLAANCNAQVTAAPVNEKICKYTLENLALKIPTGAGVESSYWQKAKGKDGESIDRQHLVLSDGSTAVIEHQYCTRYNFTIFYYAANKEDVNNEKKVAAIIDRLYSYSAVKRSFTQPLVQTLETAFKSKNYNGTAKVSVALAKDKLETTSGANYSAAYYPLVDTSLVDKGVVIFYMSGAN